MGINSCLYEVDLYHDRLKPKRYVFKHKVFMFYLDLDELSELKKTSGLLSYNSSGIYSFNDNDHITSYGATAKASVLAYVKEQGMNTDVAQVMLLTNLRTFGYIFNPVSFYFCFDAQGNPLCVVPEIGNTFKELKYFFLGADQKTSAAFEDQQTKYYYVSPFFDLDHVMDFRIQVPGERLNISIDVMNKGEKLFYSSMVGVRRNITNGSLWWETIKFPFVTLKVIVLIHWHAAVLHFIKKLPHHLKEENPDLQRGVYRGRN
ncbi:MAG: DUF1365 domain-containing protein [Candidatus Omnitrophica bacterium]|nr:DUF1365 domain-containing protein [Candidatus Omnitrophota bacterium]